MKASGEMLCGMDKGCKYGRMEVNMMANGNFHYLQHL